MPITATATHTGYVVTGTTETSDDVTDNRCKINEFYWEQPETQGHKLTITDKSGSEIITFYCDNDNESLSKEMHGIWVDGIYVSDMDSGTLHIHLA